MNVSIKATLVFSFLLSLTPIVFGQTTPTFSDVPEDHWAYSYIEEFTALGITSGCGGGNYCPDAAVTRAQIAVFMVRAIENLRADIQANASSIASIASGAGVLVYAGGEVLGQLLHGDSVGAYVLNDMGYTVYIPFTVTGQSLIYGGVNLLYFISPDCQGEPYAEPTSHSGAYFGSGRVFRSDWTDQIQLYYTPKESPVIPDLNIQSGLYMGECVNELRTIRGFAVFPNDEQITGVSDTPPLLPLTLGLP